MSNLNIERTAATADDKQQVLKSLGDPRWDFRTIAGIARETGLSEDVIADAIAQLDGQIRRSDVPDAKGRQLFTLVSRPQTGAERLGKLRNFFAKSAS